MKKILVISILSSVLFASCRGCSKSGNRPSGTKTYISGKIIGADDTLLGRSQMFLIDTNNDGKADQELVNGTNKQLHKNDSINCVLQEGIVVSWYR